MIIRCDQIVTPQGIIDGAIQLENGKITQLYKKEEIPTTSDIMDYTGKRILPGLIDVHTHGYDTWSGAAVNKNDIHSLSKAMASIGVTGYLVTVGDHFEQEMENLTAIADAIDEQQTSITNEARILGIHMEGPFLNPNRKGAFSLDQLLPPTVAKMQDYIKASRHHIRYMTLAPELENAQELMNFCIKENVLLAGGHTIATYEEYTKAIENGLSSSTHTGNAMRQMDRRDPGAYGAALLSDKIKNEVICDFFHISAQMLEVMFRIKNGGLKNFMMVSDSGSMSGLAPGTYSIKGRNKHISEEGLVVLDDGTIAGSSKNMMIGLSNLESHLNKAIENICCMTSKNPAEFLGLTNKGSIEIGKDADFVIIDENYQVLETYLEGTRIYQIGDVIEKNLEFEKECIRL